MSSPPYETHHVLALTEILERLRRRLGIVYAAVFERHFHGRPTAITDSGEMPLPAGISASGVDEREVLVQLVVAQDCWALAYWVPKELVTPTFEAAVVNEAYRMDELVCEAVNASIAARRPRRSQRSMRH